MNAHPPITAAFDQAIDTMRLQAENVILRNRLNRDVVDAEKARDAVRHVFAMHEGYKALADLAPDAAETKRASAMLEAAQSDLFCLIEDTFCLPAATLRKALNIPFGGLGPVEEDM